MLLFSPHTAYFSTAVLYAYQLVFPFSSCCTWRTFQDSPYFIVYMMSPLPVIAPHLLAPFSFFLIIQVVHKIKLLQEAGIKELKDPCLLSLPILSLFSVYGVRST